MQDPLLMETRKELMTFLESQGIVQSQVTVLFPSDKPMLSPRESVIVKLEKELKLFTLTKDGSFEVMLLENPIFEY